MASTFAVYDGQGSGRQACLLSMTVRALVAGLSHVLTRGEHQARRDATCRHAQDDHPKGKSLGLGPMRQSVRHHDDRRILLLIAGHPVARNSSLERGRCCRSRRLRLGGTSSGQQRGTGAFPADETRTITVYIHSMVRADMPEIYTTAYYYHYLWQNLRGGRALNLLTIQCRAPAGSRQRHARNSRTTITTTTTGLAGFFARGITWARARRRAEREKCTTAPNQLATPATSVVTLTCGDSQTCAMTALGYTPFASTGATPNQVSASAASVSCVSSAGKAETMGQL